MRANTFSRLAEIRVPVTLAWPEHDHIVSRLRNPPPNVRTVILRGTGHLPMWDDPAQVAELLLGASA
jgi:pimeloyl-ACP methyl ester carboxylesterase